MSMTLKRRSNPTAELLRRLPAFKGHDDRSLTRLATLVDVIDLEAAQVLTHEGHTGRESFLVIEGWADVAVRGATVATLGPGQLVGEMAMLDHQPRTATVTARTPMTVLVIGPQNFESFCADPAVSRMIAVGLSERLRRIES